MSYQNSRGIQRKMKDIPEYIWNILRDTQVNSRQCLLSLHTSLSSFSLIFIGLLFLMYSYKMATISTLIYDLQSNIHHPFHTSTHMYKSYSVFINRYKQISPYNTLKGKPFGKFAFSWHNDVPIYIKIIPYKPSAK